MDIGHQHDTAHGEVDLSEYSSLYDYCFTLSISDYQFYHRLDYGLHGDQQGIRCWRWLKLYIHQLAPKCATWKKNQSLGVEIEKVTEKRA